MKKIPTIFRRDPNDLSKVISEPHSACAWVFKNEGVATRKYDGTCCLVDGGRLYKRREVKRGKMAPPGFIEVDHDEVTGKRVGWVKVDMDAKEDRWHAEAFFEQLPDGTYELIGPKVQGNAESSDAHILIAHANAEVLDAPRTYEALPGWLAEKNIEGVVWHHEDGRMAKIKLRDFGLRRNRGDQ